MNPFPIDRQHKIRRLTMPRIRSVLVLLGALAVSALAAGSWTSQPAIGTGYDGAYSAEITSTWTTCLVNETKGLKAARASRDKDTRNGCALLYDTLHNRWPRWTATNGTFAGTDATGTSVQWTAPGSPQSVMFCLYENDTPTPVDPPDKGSRDDSVTIHDSKMVSVEAE